MGIEEDRPISDETPKMKASQGLLPNDPVLPTTLPFRPSPETRTASNKRDLDDLFAMSSDPPLFSSDDLPAASAENYLQPRDKSQHRRAWYEEEESAKRVCLRGSRRTPREKGPFQRNFDSGVWLGSDDSLPSEGPESESVPQCSATARPSSSLSYDDDDNEPVLQLSNDSDSGQDKMMALRDKALQTIEDPGNYIGPVFPYWQPQPANLKRYHFLQEHAATLIATCVDQGKEEVDLS